jgi:tetratricopeptide (TPR) repeat protein
MRRFLIALADVIVCTGALQAGVYNTEEPLARQVAPDRQRDFDRLLEDLMGVATEPTDQKPLRALYLQRIAALEERAQRGLINNEERTNLGAYYLRLRRYEEAARIIEAIPFEQRNFLAWSNLGSAYQNSGLWERAESCLEQSLRSWPQIWAGWPWRLLVGFRRIELFQLELVRKRGQEARLGRRGDLTLDAIFPRVRFVGPSGEYEAGALAAEQWNLLPADALGIVKQLVLWFPFDDRLQWLLAELLNARGDVQPALTYLSAIEKRVNLSRELHRHRLVLLEPNQVNAVMLAAGDQVAGLHAQLSLPVIEPWLPPGASAILMSAGWVTAFDQVQKGLAGQTTATTAAPSTGEETAATTAKSDSGLQLTWFSYWPYMLTSFLAGAVMMALLNLQLREIRRRKERARTTTP